VSAAGEWVLKRAEAPAPDVDRELVAGAIAGDLSAFDALVDRHWAKVAAVASRFLDDPNEVEDAAQEAFVQAYRNLRSFRGDASVRTWLLRIVANVCRSRKRSFWWQRISLGENSESSGIEPVDPQLLVEAAASTEALDRAIEALPERLRLPLVLYFYEELSGREVAAALGWSENTVWSRIYAAYRELRKTLGEP
jgi:RNA polymerase sigma-70 factor (ECF subfamily)